MAQNNPGFDMFMNAVIWCGSVLTAFGAGVVLGEASKERELRKLLNDKEKSNFNKGE